MVLVFDDLRQHAVGRQTREAQAVLFEPVLVGGVDLVTMTMPLEQARDRTQSQVFLSANLTRVNEVAKRSRQTRFTALLHHVDVAALERAYRRLRRQAAPGVDGVTVESYGQDLEGNLRDLADRVHGGRFRPLPVRRTYIPKADGGQRPLGILALEDKIVQCAVAEVLSASMEVGMAKSAAFDAHQDLPTFRARGLDNGLAKRGIEFDKRLATHE